MTNELLQSALDYAGRGWPVLPLHSIKGGRCACGRPDCGSPGKHPRTARGLKDASTDPATIERWWRRWPVANIGIATGAAAGLVVLDVDPRHDGDESLAELIAEHGPLPRTIEAATGGGGRHLAFAHPGGSIPNRANIRPGLDIRGDGGYIVVPPSLHASGRTYTWLHGPDDLRPAPLPAWLRELIDRPAEPAPRPAGAPPAPTPPMNGDGRDRLLERAQEYVAKVRGVGEGQRNDAAFRLAGNLAAMHGPAGERLNAGDITELLRGWNDRNDPPLPDDELRRTVESASRNGTPRAPKPPAGPSPASTTSPPRPIEPFRPFPVDALPEPIRSLVADGSRAIGCDPSFIGLPLLAAAASAIGMTRRLSLKRGWSEPSIIWGVIVGESGTLKSPALELALRPVRRRQAEAMRRHAAELERYAIEYAQYERDYAVWRRSQDPCDPPMKPREPVPDRCWCDDTTIEALAGLLIHQPRGLLCARDELSGWLSSFDRYANTRGSDAAKWCEMFGGRPLLVDRKTGTPRTLHVPAAAVSLTGGIQPETLRRALADGEYIENGLAARLLLAMPPRRAKRWTEADVDPAVEDAVSRVFDRLYGLEHDIVDRGELYPRLVRLSGAAKGAWVAFYDQHAKEHADLTGELSAAWSKLEGYAARLALVVHFIRWAAGDPAVEDPDVIDARSVESGIELSRWFGHEARRVYAVLAEGDEDRDRRRLAEWIGRHGGSVTVRDLVRGVWQYRGRPDEARAALDELAKVGLGRWTCPAPGQAGGRPVERFELVGDIDIDKTPAGGGENEGFVDVEDVDESHGEAPVPLPEPDEEGWVTI